MQPVSIPKRIRFTLPHLFTLMTVAAVVFAGVYYFMSFREASLRRKKDSWCESNLRQIGLALTSYESVHKCFPPPYVADAQGKPLYSWRVLMLPYLEEVNLYRQWHLDEPWDSPHNRSLPMPQGLFSCPASERNRQTGNSPYTDYLAVVGPGMAWEKGKRLALADFVDNWRDTVMVVEVRGSRIHWAEPVDFDATTLLQFNATQGLSIGSHKGQGAHVMLGSCKVVHLPDTTSPQEFKALLTRAGGEHEPWLEEGRFDEDYPGYWFGDLRWTGQSWEGKCTCADRELPFSINFDVSHPTDEQKARALVATRKTHSGRSEYNLELDTPWDETKRVAAAKKLLAAAPDPSDDAPWEENVRQLSSDMTLESLRVRYSVGDGAVCLYLVYNSPQCYPNKKIRVRLSTDPTIGKLGEVTVIRAIDEVTVIDE